jgi:hypothetical protein
MNLALRVDETQQRVLLALASGAMLKVHRTLDGEKAHRLHAGDGTGTEVDAAVVASLLVQGLIESNMKFPAATFLLTEAGVAAAAQLGGALRPLTPRRYR